MWRSSVAVIPGPGCVQFRKVLPRRRVLIATDEDGEGNPPAASRSWASVPSTEGTRGGRKGGGPKEARGQNKIAASAIAAVGGGRPPRVPPLRSSLHRCERARAALPPPRPVSLPSCHSAQGRGRLERTSVHCRSITIGKPVSYKSPGNRWGAHFSTSGARALSAREPTRTSCRSCDNGRTGFSNRLTFFFFS